MRARGDDALRELTERFDGCRIDRFRVPDDELDAAPSAIPTDVRDALEFARRQIHAYHRLQTPPEVRLLNEGIAVREIVREKDIFLREHARRVGTLTYLFSKLIFFASVSDGPGT